MTARRAALVVAAVAAATTLAGCGVNTIPTKQQDALAKMGRGADPVPAPFRPDPQPGRHRPGLRRPGARRAGRRGQRPLPRPPRSRSTPRPSPIPPPSRPMPRRRTA
ncbi:MAG: hypothetical protein WDN45_01105 [Caulobacteraceae bacterium]